MNNQPTNLDQYRTEKAAQNAAEFYSGEQVDLHASTLERLTQQAMIAAEVGQHVESDATIDTSRVEGSGSNVTKLTPETPSAGHETSPDVSSVVLAYGRILEGVRRAHLEQTHRENAA